jgi:hypothetical protein
MISAADTCRLPSSSSIVSSQQRMNTERLGTVNDKCPRSKTSTGRHFGTVQIPASGHPHLKGSTGPPSQPVISKSTPRSAEQRHCELGLCEAPRSALRRRSALDVRGSFSSAPPNEKSPKPFAPAHVAVPTVLTASVPAPSFESAFPMFAPCQWPRSRARSRPKPSAAAPNRGCTTERRLRRRPDLGVIRKFQRACAFVTHRKFACYRHRSARLHAPRGQHPRFFPGGLPMILRRPQVDRHRRDGD